jgi:lysophospholipase L1-like esterase
MKKTYLNTFILLSLVVFFGSFSCSAQQVTEQTDSESQNLITRQYICIGDSITNGYANTSVQAYPHQLSLTLGANSYKFPEGNTLPSGWLTQIPGNQTTFINYGIDSQRIETMLANVGTQVGSRLGDANETTVILLAGINDIGVGRTAAQVEADWMAYGAWCRANNVKLYIATMTAVGHPAFNATKEEANMWLRANWQLFADKLIDFGRNQALDNPANSAYFHPDQGHPTALGDLQMALIAGSVINGTYQSPTIAEEGVPTGFFRLLYDRTLTATGGDGAITWSHRSGTLPTGIVFNSVSHKFEGIPTVSGTFPNIVIRATDATGDFYERTYSIAITRKYTLCSRALVRNCVFNF